MKFYRKYLIALLALLLVIPVVLARAQINLLNDDEMVSAELTAAMPLAFYTFNGAVGDIVTIRAAAGIDSALTPVISVIDPGQRQIAISGGQAANAEVVITISRAGTYSLLVGGDGTLGAFTLWLGRSADEVTTAPSITPSPDAEMPEVMPGLDVTATPSPTADLCVASGTALVTIRRSPSTAADVVTLIERGESVPVLGIFEDWYGVSVFGAVGWVRQVDVLLNGGCDHLPMLTLGGMPITPTPTPPPPSTEGCAVTSATLAGIHIRPSARADIYGLIERGESYPIVGMYQEWYGIEIMPGAVGWVRRADVALIGACGNLPTLDPDRPIFTPTPRPVGVAPQGPTQSFSWRLVRDAAVIQTYRVGMNAPDWHRMAIMVDGLAQGSASNEQRTFIFAVVCDGPGAADLRWAVATPGFTEFPYSCNQRVTYTFSAGQEWTIHLRSLGDQPVNYVVEAHPGGTPTGLSQPTENYQWELLRDPIGDFRRTIDLMAPGWHVTRITVGGLEATGPNMRRAYTITLLCEGAGSADTVWWTDVAPDAHYGCGAGSITQTFAYGDNRIDLHIRTTSNQPGR